MSDRQIIDSILAGSEEVLKDLYINYREEFVSWLIKNYRCSMDDALEIFQLSIVILYDNVMVGKLVTLSSSLKSYLFAIGKNKVKELKRRQSKFGFEIDEQLLKQVTDDNEDHNEAEISLMNKALRHLGGVCKELLEMYYYQNLTMQQISDLLEYKNTGTTKNMKYKCLKRLRKIFADQSTKN